MDCYTSVTTVLTMLFSQCSRPADTDVDLDCITPSHRPSSLFIVDRPCVVPLPHESLANYSWRPFSHLLCCTLIRPYYGDGLPKSLFRRPSCTKQSWVGTTIHDSMAELVQGRCRTTRTPYYVGPSGLLTSGSINVLFVWIHSPHPPHLLLYRVLLKMRQLLSSCVLSQSTSDCRVRIENWRAATKKGTIKRSRA